MKELTVWRIGSDKPIVVGTVSSQPITFTYDRDYLENPSARAISLSLPLRVEPYDEKSLMPYFDGLLPENETRSAIAQALRIAPNDFLTILLKCGRDIIGDIAITEGEEPIHEGSYEPFDLEKLDWLFSGFLTLAESNRESRLSLAGSQGKTGLAHTPGFPMEEGWSRPVGGAASTHILKISTLPDIPLLEYLCMNAARSVGICVPSVDIIEFNRPVLCIERFDRGVSFENGSLRVDRFHQEDLAQAFGVLPQAKYSELEPSTAEAITNLLRNHSTNPIEDIEEFALVTLFNYLVGNCDNHLKNLSVLYGASWGGFKLAPAYDLVSTTRYERFSTEMGMDINGKREIAEINAEDWFAFSGSIGMHGDELKALCGTLAANVPAAIQEAAERHPTIADLPWVADALCEELRDRQLVLEQVAQS